MSTHELIAAALTAADKMDEMTMSFCSSIHPNSDDLREACARAMVQPDMAEVGRLVDELVHQVENDDDLYERLAARTALLDYVRGVLTERDQFSDAAKMVSAAPQPVGGVPMPEENILQISALQNAEVRWIDRKACLTYGDAREAAGYAAGVAAGGEVKPVGEVPMLDADATAYALHNYGDAREAAGYAAGVADAAEYREILRLTRLHMSVPTAWSPRTVNEFVDRIDAALRGEVKP